MPAQGSPLQSISERFPAGLEAQNHSSAKLLLWQSGASALRAAAKKMSFQGPTECEEALCLQLLEEVWGLARVSPLPGAETCVSSLG